MVVDFCLPNPGQSLLEALQMWDNKTGKASADYSFHMASPGGANRCSTRWPTVVDRGITSFKHFMAYKGALMVNDDEMFASFQRCAALGALPLVHAENGDVVARCTQKFWPRAMTARKATPIRGRPKSRARRPTAPS
jgi:dihydropyrimidinase